MSGITDLFFTSLDKASSWASSNSVWPLSFGLSCCAIEMIHAAASNVDLDQFGSLFRSSPKHADLMIIGGTVTFQMLPQVINLYNQMLSPKWVIAMGNCAITGGIFADSYSVVKGIDKEIKIDEEVRGCPPPPEELAKAILRLQKKIKKH